MSSPLEDFGKNTLGLSSDDVQALEGVAAAIGTISGLIGYVLAVKGILTTLGLFKQTDEVKDLVDQLWQNFQVVLAAESQAAAMRDVANQVEKARAELENFKESAPEDPAATGIDPVWVGLRPLVLDNTIQAVDTLGDPRYWQRPFFPDLVYQDWWVGILTPPVEGNLVFDYRLTLPAYLEAITIRIVILAALVKDYRVKNADEIQQYVTALEGYYSTIRDGIVEHRAPGWVDLPLLPRTLPNPDGRLPCNWLKSGDPLAGTGDLFGAVERYSTFHILDQWPAQDFPNGNELSLWNDLEGSYWKFRVQHVIRSMTRWKQVYKKVGLEALAATIAQLRALVGISPVTVEPPTGDWSVRELAQHVAAISGFGVTSEFTILPHEAIHLNKLLKVLQTFSPVPYTSLRAALSQ